MEEPLENTKMHQEDLSHTRLSAGFGLEPDKTTLFSGYVSNPFPIYVAAGVLFFSSVNYLTRYTVPTAATKTFQSRWKWRNVLTSFIHSFITGVSVFSKTL